MRERPILELLTHGVSGTPAEAILDCDRVIDADATCITADGKGAFTKPATQPPHLNGADHQRIAYRWGDMTSGFAIQALWALFAPFALVNVASWMLPLPRDTFDRWMIGISRALFRLIALSLTALLMAQLTSLFAGILLTQCQTLQLSKSNAGCWHWMEADWHGMQNTAVRSWVSFAFVAGIVTLGAILALAVDNDRDLRGTDPAPPLTENCPAVPGVASDDFVRPRDARAPILLTTHAMAGILTPASVLAGDFRGFGWLRVVAFIGIGLAVLATILCDDPRGSGGTFTQGGPTSRMRLLWWLFTGHRSVYWVAASGAVLVNVCGWVLPSNMDEARSQASSSDSAIGLGGDHVVTWVFWCALALVAATFPLLAIYFSGGHARLWLGGFHAPLLAGIAVLLGAGAGVAVTRVVAGVISTDPNPPPSNVFEKIGGWFHQALTPDWIAQSGYSFPSLYSELAWAWGATAVGSGALIVLVVVRSGYKRGKVRNSLNNDLMENSQRRWRIQAAIADAKLHIPAAIGLISSGLAAVGLIRLFRPAWIDASTWLETVGVLGLFAAAALLLWSIYNAIRRPHSAGRSLGVLWDLASFWPREGHPLVPPAYAPRAIRDIEAYAGNAAEGTRLILCGHSQGSLIMYAVARRLAAAQQTNVSLLTYGSQLGWAYGRAFPSALDHDSIVALGKSVNGRWINLARFTDYLGDGVFSNVRYKDLQPYRDDVTIDPKKVSTEVDVDVLRVEISPLPADNPSPTPTADTSDTTDTRRTANTGPATAASPHHNPKEIWLPDPSPGDWPRERTRKHSGYTSDPTWNCWISELAERATSSQLGPTPPSGPQQPAPQEEASTATSTHANTDQSTKAGAGQLPTAPRQPIPGNATPLAVLPSGSHVLVFVGGLSATGAQTCTVKGMAKNLKRACELQYPDSGSFDLDPFKTDSGDGTAVIPVTKLTRKPTPNATPPDQPLDAKIYDFAWSEPLIKQWQNRSAFRQLLSVVAGLAHVASFLRYFSTAGKKNPLGRTQLALAVVMAALLIGYCILLAVTVITVCVATARSAIESPPNGSTTTSSTTSATAAASPAATTSPASASSSPLESEASPTTAPSTSASGTGESGTEPWDVLSEAWFKLSVGASAVGGVIIAVARKPVTDLLRSGEVLAVAQSYLNIGDGAGTASAQLDDLVRQVSSETPKPKVTIIAYSFGSLVAIDTLFPTTDKVEVLSHVDRLVTIGAPFDFARAFKPTWETAERHAAGVYKDNWTNLYSTIDLLGSNFNNNTPTSKPNVGVSITGGRIIPNSNLSWDIGVEPRVLNLIAFYGFASHNMYWSEDPPDRNVFTDLVGDIFA